MRFEKYLKYVNNNNYLFVFFKYWIFIDFPKCCVAIRIKINTDKAYANFS